MRTVAILALDDVIAFDLSVPVEVFGRVVLPSGANGYHLQVSAPSRWCRPDRCVSAPITAWTHWPARTPSSCPAQRRRRRRCPPTCSPRCAAAHARGRPHRLDLHRRLRAGRGRAARRASAPPRTGWPPTCSAPPIPAVDLDPDVLYVDEGPDPDLGRRVGRTGSVPVHGAAGPRCRRRGRPPPGIAVAPLHRSGGQAQFIVRNTLPAQRHRRANRTGRGAGVHRGERPPRHHPDRYRRTRRDECAHPQPALPGRGRPDTDAVGQRRARAARPGTPRTLRRMASSASGATSDSARRPTSASSSAGSAGSLRRVTATLSGSGRPAERWPDRGAA